MPTDIRPCMHVRAALGMYQGSRGRVVSVTLSPRSGPIAMVDVGGTTVAMYSSSLEPIAETPTVEQERDAAIAERDRLRFDVQRLRDRLRRGENIRFEQVAEMLGDMLEEP